MIYSDIAHYIGNKSCEIIYNILGKSVHLRHDVRIYKNEKNEFMSVVLTVVCEGNNTDYRFDLVINDKMPLVPVDGHTPPRFLTEFETSSISKITREITDRFFRDLANANFQNWLKKMKSIDYDKDYEAKILDH